MLNRGLMIDKVPKADKDAEFREICTMMEQTSSGCIAVCAENRPFGIITAIDIVKAVAECGEVSLDLKAVDIVRLVE